jgi:glycine/D-amino acid oxidase-like deaminating enzyme
MNFRKMSGVENLDTEIVIIGGGGAGLAAAVSAAERCAKIIVIEKRQTPGGNSNLAFGLFGAESPVQKRMGIDAGRDDLLGQPWAIRIGKPIKDCPYFRR